jgi:hypothetical protein
MSTAIPCYPSSWRYGKSLCRTTAGDNQQLERYDCFQKMGQKQRPTGGSPKSYWMTWSLPTGPQGSQHGS